MKTPRTATCSSPLEQEPRLEPGEKLDWDRKQGGQKGDSEQRPLPGEKSRLAAGRTGATAGPSPTDPRSGGALSSAGPGPPPGPGGSSSAG